MALSYLQSLVARNKVKERKKVGAQGKEQQRQSAKIYTQHQHHDDEDGPICNEQDGMSDDDYDHDIDGDYIAESSFGGSVLASGEATAARGDMPAAERIDVGKGGSEDNSEQGQSREFTEISGVLPIEKSIQAHQYSAPVENPSPILLETQQEEGTAGGEEAEEGKWQMEEDEEEEEEEEEERSPSYWKGTNSLAVNNEVAGLHTIKTSKDIPEPFEWNCDDENSYEDASETSGEALRLSRMASPVRMPNGEPAVDEAEPCAPATVGSSSPTLPNGGSKGERSSNSHGTGFDARQKVYLKKLMERRGTPKIVEKDGPPKVSKARQMELQKKFEAKNLERLQKMAEERQKIEAELKKKEEMKARRREKMRRAILASRAKRIEAAAAQAAAAAAAADGDNAEKKASENATESRKIRRGRDSKGLPVGSATAAVRAIATGRGDTSNTTLRNKKEETEPEETEEERQERRRRAKEAAERIRARQAEHLRKVSEQKLRRKKQQESKDSKAEKLRSRLKADMLVLAAEVREQKRIAAEQKAKEDAEAAANAPPPVVLSAAERKANFDAFLGRVKDSQEKREAKAGREETDETRWRKKNGIEDGQKVFVITGLYPSLKKALLNRGWFHNTDRDSPFFDLKWTIASKHIDHKAIQPGQVVNHFSKASKIVTKVGLMTSLKCLPWFANANQDHFFPRCYDLTNDGDRLDMIGDFYTVHCLNILNRIFQKTGLSLPDARPSTSVLRSRAAAKKAIAAKAGNPQRASNHDEEDDDDDDDDDEEEDDDDDKAEEEEEGLGEINVDECTSVTPDFAITSQGQDVVHCRADINHLRSLLVDFERPKVNQGLLELVLRVLEMQTQIFDDAYIDSGQAPITDSPDGLPLTPEQWQLLLQSDIFSPSEEPEEPKENDDDKGDSVSKTQATRKKRNKRTKKKKLSSAAWDFSQTIEISDKDMLRILVILDAVRVTPSFQVGINGAPSQNVWIVKPAGKSRGRGIECFSDLSAILKHTSTTMHGCAETQWVVQKYIENPLIIHKRKFDIRQWVLVTSFNPLRVYFYNDCYLRFCAHDYDLKDLDNKFIHLANNSISKKSKQFKTSPIEGNMWHSDDFCEYLTGIHGDDALWHKKILPRMKQAVAWSLMSVQDMVNHREGSHELYGYDFMVDADYNTWLIEVNSSPAMDYSTPITERLVKSVLPDTIKVVVDFEKPFSKRKKPIRRIMKKSRKADTGRWELIYAAKRAVDHPLAMGANLEIQGLPLRKKKSGKNKKA
eukprot:g5317.t1